jgi:hypothetical protein
MKCALTLERRCGAYGKGDKRYDTIAPLMEQVEAQGTPSLHEAKERINENGQVDHEEVRAMRSSHLSESAT